LYRFFFISYRDGNEHANPAWLFQNDVFEVARQEWDGFAWRGRSEHSDSEHSGTQRVPNLKDRPFITGYRVLVSAMAVSFGTAKAYLSYRGKEAAPKAVEWAYGAVVSLRYVQVNCAGTRALTVILASIG
jgi:hypothetical protein